MVWEFCSRNVVAKFFFFFLENIKNVIRNMFKMLYSSEI